MKLKQNQIIGVKGQIFNIPYSLSDVGLSYLKSKQNEIEILIVKYLDVQRFYQILKQFKTFNNLKGISYTIYQRQEDIEKLQNYLEEIKNIVARFTNLQYFDIQFYNNDIQNSQNIIQLSIINIISHLNYLKHFRFQRTFFEFTTHEAISLGYSLIGLSNLESLQLYFYKADFIDEKVGEVIGKAFQNFKKLIHLEIEIINFQPQNTSNRIKQIFNGVKFLINLKTLSLKINHLQQESENAICTLAQSLMEIQQLESLSLIVTSKSKLKQGFHQLIESIRYLTNLQSLQLYITKNDNIDEAGMILFGKTLYDLSNLLDLTIHFKNDICISKPSSEEIYLGISKLQVVKKINFVFEKKVICPEEFATIVRGFRFLNSLQKLYIHAQYKCKVGEEGAKGLGEGLSGLINLKKLRLVIDEYNYINKEGCKGISYSLKQLISLKNLEIRIRSENRLNEGSQFLMKAIKYLTNLESLSITIGRQSKFGDQGCYYLAKSLQKLQSLQKLKLHFGFKNSISILGFCLLGEGIAKLQSLKQLIINASYFNHFKNNDFPLMQGFEQLQNLNVLYLQLQFYNQLSQELVKSIAMSVGKLRNVKQITLYLYPNFLQLNSLNTKIIYKYLQKLTKLSIINIYFLRQQINDQLSQTRYEKQLIQRHLPRLVKFILS